MLLFFVFGFVRKSVAVRANSSWFVVSFNRPRRTAAMWVCLCWIRVRSAVCWANAHAHIIFKFSGLLLKIKKIEFTYCIASSRCGMFVLSSLLNLIFLLDDSVPIQFKFFFIILYFTLFVVVVVITVVWSYLFKPCLAQCLHVSISFNCGVCLIRYRRHSSSSN